MKEDLIFFSYCSFFPDSVSSCSLRREIYQKKWISLKIINHVIVITCIFLLSTHFPQTKIIFQVAGIAKYILACLEKVLSSFVIAISHVIIRNGNRYKVRFVVLMSHRLLYGYRISWYFTYFNINSRRIPGFSVLTIPKNRNDTNLLITINI